MIDVDLLGRADDVGPATAFLSYTWYYTLADTIAALNEWVKTNGRDPKRTYVWMDALCLNQHRISEQLSPELVAAEFGPRVEAIGRILPMLHPWDDPVYTHQAWCLFKLYTAIQNRKSVDLDIIITPSHMIYTNPLDCDNAGNRQKLRPRTRPRTRNRPPNRL